MSLAPQARRFVAPAARSAPALAAFLPRTRTHQEDTMTFQAEPGVIRWKLHLRSEPGRVFDMLATDAGRARFWAEAAEEHDGRITFHILNYVPFSGAILAREAPTRFALEYYGTTVQFELAADGRGGTDLSLHASAVDASIHMEMVAGWVSVLLALKAAVDYGVDLRNHDATRAWAQGYCDN
jgi:uncharacterized protein YndB with AHSA1/START domain